MIIRISAGAIGLCLAFVGHHDRARADPIGAEGNTGGSQIITFEMPPPEPQSGGMGRLPPYLLEKTNVTPVKEVLIQPPPNPDEALFLAAGGEDAAEIRRLIDAGAKVNGRHPSTGMTPRTFPNDAPPPRPTIADPSLTPPQPPDSSGRLLHEPQLQIDLLGRRPIQPPPPPEGQPQPSPDDGAQRVIALYNTGVDAWNSSLQLWRSGNFGASRQKCQQAQSIFTQVRQVSPSMISGMSCSFREPNPKDPAPDWSQCGPFISHSPAMPASRTPLNRWNE